MRLIQPTYPNEYGTVALVPSDFDARVQKTLAPYSTTGRNQVFFWRVTSDVSIGSQVALADGTGAVLFKLSSMPGYADLAAVFDTYRLRAVSVSIMPSNGVLTVSGSAVAPRLWTAIDYDDASSLSRNALEQYDTVIVSPPGNGVIRTLCPRFALSAYAGGSFSNFAQSEPDQWIDIASPSVEYYGIKYAIEAGAMGQTILQMYSCSVTAFWEFKSSR
jgi:hypothetical protein